MLVHDRHMIALAVGRYTGQHFVEDYPKAVNVSLLIYLLAENLLWRHVLGRTDDVTGFGQLRIAAGARGGDTEVHDFHQAFVVDQDVGGF